MLKKAWLFLVVLAMGLILGACGSDTTSISESDENLKKEKSANSEQDSKNKEEAEDPKDDANEDIQEDENLKATNTYTDKELGITGKSGPIEYEISGVQLKELEIKSEEAASMFEANVGDVVHAITIKMSGENTSDDDVSFYLGQATIVTDTKEQLEPDMLLSEHIEGEYLGQVQHEGFNVYILKKSKVSDLKTIEIRVNGPSDNSLDRVGEDVKQTIEVNK